MTKHIRNDGRGFGKRHEDLNAVLTDDGCLSGHGFTTPTEANNTLGRRFPTAGRMLAVGNRAPAAALPPRTS